MADRKRRLVYGILEFLQASVDDGTVRADDKESMEVAMQCLSESFGVDFPGDKQLSMKPSNLLQVFEVFAKTQDKRQAASGSGASASTSASTGASAASAPKPASEADKAAAEEAKVEGNRLMSKKAYPEAIAKYSEAVKADPANPVYYSNRAAAYSQKGDHESAIADALKASEVDPTFAKAYSRLGHAYFSSGKYQEAVDAYEKGLELEPANSVMKSSLSLAKSKLPASAAPPADADDYDAVDPAARGAPGGGMPNLGGMDFASMLNNPQVAAMMQQMQQNGGLQRMMQDPAIRQMAQNMMGGGGMPDMSQLMNNPALRDMAQNMMGGGGAGGAGGRGNNSRNGDDMFS